MRHSILAALASLAVSFAHADGNARQAREAASPYLFVLGVAQDAGYPQAGCFKSHCLPGWKDRDRRLGATAVGLVLPAERRTYLFEATPHIGEQIYRLEREAPGFELSGLFLTHAHIGHYAGLMFLGHEAMGASGVPVHAMPRMREFLRSNGPWSQLVEFGNIELKELWEDDAVALGPVRVTPFLVPHRDEYSETAGYRIEGPERTAVFIPDIDKWTEWDRDLREVVRSVDYALIDATFFADDELPGRDMAKIRHPFVRESMTLLDGLPARERAKVWFIHMNHTNPMLRPDSEESELVRERGYNIAREGMTLPL